MLLLPHLASSTQIQLINVGTRKPRRQYRVDTMGVISRPTLHTLLLIGVVSKLCLGRPHIKWSTAQIQHRGGGGRQTRMRRALVVGWRRAPTEESMLTWGEGMGQTDERCRCGRAHRVGMVGTSSVGPTCEGYNDNFLCNKLPRLQWKIFRDATNFHSIEHWPINPSSCTIK